jgi:hypothetical protein
VPQTPAEVLETLALLEKTGDFGANLNGDGIKGGTGWREGDKGHTFQVFVSASASPRLEKAMKDLLPWKE